MRALRDAVIAVGFAIASVLLVVSWAASYTRAHLIGYVWSDTSEVGIIAWRGCIVIEWIRCIDAGPSKQGFRIHVRDAGSPAVLNMFRRPPNRLGLGYTSAKFGYKSMLHKLWCPHVIFVLVSAAFAYRSFRRLRRRLIATSDGAIPCAKCGYDLRATPNACPECGMKARSRTTLKR
jgi:hypothetical protein